VRASLLPSLICLSVIFGCGFFFVSIYFNRQSNPNIQKRSKKSNPTNAIFMVGLIFFDERQPPPFPGSGSGGGGGGGGGFAVSPSPPPLTEKDSCIVRVLISLFFFQVQSACPL
ncbi:MAG: hypothetical protein U9N86_15370, partial [Bacteroidota bacterium]|nr:hypothetical protein [Bacteroidota bacterium]